MMAYRMILAALATVSVALAAAPAQATAAVAAETATDLAPNKFVWSDAAPTDVSIAPDPVYIVISVPDQRAYVYRGERLVAASSVSTGKGDKPTPIGSFAILQKEEDHKSNLYDSAPMPFMQRLTWDGVAIHAGRNPGFPASHGCIRVPAAFAKKLYDITDLGTVVAVIDEPVIDPSVMPAFELPDTFDSAGTADANAAQLDRMAAK